MKEDPTYNVLLLKEVEKYPVLYNPSVQGHTNRDIQDDSWLQIAVAMNDSPTNIKERWKHLRACLCRHLRNVHKHGLNKKPYYLVQHMEFLIPFTKTRASISQALALAEESALLGTSSMNTSCKTEYSETCSDSGDPPASEGGGTNADGSLPGLGSPMVTYDEDMLNQQMVSSTEPENFLSVKYEQIDDSDSPGVNSGAPVNSVAEHFAIHPTSDPFHPPSPKYPKLMKSTKRPKEEEDSYSKKVIEALIKEQNDPDINFLKSFLPDMKQMTLDQKHRFKTKMLATVGDILYPNNDSTN